MREIHLNILGLKNFETEELQDLLNGVNRIKLLFDDLLYEPVNGLKFKIRKEISRRENSKQVWVRFTCSWSGYSNNPSAPRRTLGAEYRKINREIAEKMPKYYCHEFSDSTTNDWHIEIVSVKGKEKGSSYSRQVDEFMKQLTTNSDRM